MEEDEISHPHFMQGTFLSHSLVTVFSVQIPLLDLFRPPRMADDGYYY